MALIYEEVMMSITWLCSLAQAQECWFLQAQERRYFGSLTSVIQCASGDNVFASELPQVTIILAKDLMLLVTGSGHYVVSQRHFDGTNKGFLLPAMHGGLIGPLKIHIKSSFYQKNMF